MVPARRGTPSGSRYSASIGSPGALASTLPRSAMEEHFPAVSVELPQVAIASECAARETYGGFEILAGGEQ